MVLLGNLALSLTRLIDELSVDVLKSPFGEPFVSENGQKRGKEDEEDEERYQNKPHELTD